MSLRNHFWHQVPKKSPFFPQSEKSICDTFSSIFQKISIFKKNKKVVPKSVFLDDFWQISEF